MYVVHTFFFLKLGDPVYYLKVSLSAQVMVNLPHWSRLLPASHCQPGKWHHAPRRKRRHLVLLDGTQTGDTPKEPRGGWAHTCGWSPARVGRAPRTSSPNPTCDTKMDETQRQSEKQTHYASVPEFSAVQNTNAGRQKAFLEIFVIRIYKNIVICNVPLAVKWFLLKLTKQTAIQTGYAFSSWDRNREDGEPGVGR